MRSTPLANVILSAAKELLFFAEATSHIVLR